MGTLNEHKLTYSAWIDANPHLLKEDHSTKDLEMLYEEYISGFDLHTD